MLYALVCDSEVIYVGICEGGSRTLKNRMNSYRSPGSKSGKGSTNKKVREGIRTLLEEGHRVRIFALEPVANSDSSHRYKSLAVDLVKGLENPMIDVFDPIWNHQAPSRITERKEEKQQNKEFDKIAKLASKDDLGGLMAIGLSKEQAKEWIELARNWRKRAQDRQT